MNHLKAKLKDSVLYTINGVDYPSGNKREANTAECKLVEIYHGLSSGKASSEDEHIRKVLPTLKSKTIPGDNIKIISHEDGSREVLCIHGKELKYFNINEIEVWEIEKQV